MSRDAEFEEIQTKNRFLSDKIQKLEKSLLKRSSGAVTVSILVSQQKFYFVE